MVKIHIHASVEEMSIKALISEHLELAFPNDIKILDYERLNEVDIVFVICTPYSTSKSGVHCFAGAVEAINLRDRKLSTDSSAGNKSAIVLVPVCLCGQLASELPVFLSANQGLVLMPELDKDKDKNKNEAGEETKLEKFGQMLIKSVELNGAVKSTSKDNEFAKKWPGLWQGSEGSEGSGGCEGSEVIPMGQWNCILDTDQHNKIVVRSHEKSTNEGLSVGWQDFIENMTRLVRKMDNGPKKDFGYHLSFGVCPFIWDGSDLCVGLTLEQRKPSEHFIYSMGSNINESPDDLKRFCAKVEAFDQHMLSGTSSALQLIESLRTPSETKYRAIEVLKGRLNSMGLHLWEVDLPGFEKSQDAMVLVNDSDSIPRLEISLIRILSSQKLMASNMNADEDSMPVFIVPPEPALFDRNWIWAADGHVKYWYYTKAKDITAYIHSDVVSEENLEYPVLVNKDILLEKFGFCCSKTPYSADEDREGAPIEEPFSVTARTALICF